MTHPSLNTSGTSSKQALVEPVECYFRFLLSFGIVPPGFENCVPQIPAAEPWDEESVREEVGTDDEEPQALAQEKRG